MPKPTDFKTIINASVAADGQSSSLTIERHDGQTLELTFDADVLNETVSNLTKFASDTAEVRTGGKPVKLETGLPTNFSTTRVHEIGLGLGDDGKTMVLFLRIFDFDLAYHLTTSTLRELAQSFGEMVKALDADEAKRN